MEGAHLIVTFVASGSSTIRDTLLEAFAFGATAMFQLIKRKSDLRLQHGVLVFQWPYIPQNG